MTHSLSDFANRTSPQTYHFKTNSSISADLLRDITTQLRRRGAVAYDLHLPETKYLTQILHKDENIMGAVFGKYKDGRGAMIATDQRVLVINKKPLFLQCDELTYTIVAGVSFSKSPLISYVTLHTRLGDFKFKTFNLKGAANFVDYIETKCVQNLTEEKYGYVT